MKNYRNWSEHFKKYNKH